MSSAPPVTLEKSRVHQQSCTGQKAAGKNFRARGALYRETPGGYQNGHPHPLAPYGTGSSFSPVFFLVTNGLAGDVEGDMSGSAQGGNDTLIGGSNSGSGDGFLVRNLLQGDANNMFDDTHGGNDTLIGGNNSGNGNGLVTNGLVGDAGAMLGSAQGGNDTLIGGNTTPLGNGRVENFLTGDGGFMSGSAQGGNDTLIGGSNSGSGSVENTLRGDAFRFFAGGSVHAGDDTLVAGTASAGTVKNTMWGDAQIVDAGATVTFGHDTFVFQDNVAAGQTVGTQNFIGDFQQGLDVIKFIGVVGASSFAELSPHITTVSGNTIIETQDDKVTLLGFTGTLTAQDFAFA